MAQGLLFRLRQHPKNVNPMKVNEMHLSIPVTAQRPLEARLRWPGHNRWVGLWILLLLAVSFFPQFIWADTHEPVPLSLAKFTTGIITAYSLHETGHAVAASSESL